MKISKVSDLGTAIKKRRKELGYTQRTISELTGLSASFISEIENGKVTAELGKVLLLINLLGMDLFVEDRG